VVADLGVGLVRLQRGRHHMLDMFRSAPDAGAAAAPDVVDGGRLDVGEPS
jgi:hypothetical protein